MLHDLDTTHGPERTGRTLVLFRDDAGEEGAADLNRVAGITAVRSQDTGDQPAILEAVDAGAVVMSELSVAVVDADPEQVRALAGAVGEENAILAIEPERVVQALEATVPSGDYLRGFRDAAAALADSYTLTPDSRSRIAGFDETQATWGLQAGGVCSHPHRQGHQGRRAGHRLRRSATPTSPAATSPRSRSSRAEPPHDGHGHGTHCIGTSCGPRTPRHRPALRHRLRGGDLRRQGAEQRRQRHGRADPRGHRLGDHQPVPRAVDVARRRRPQAALSPYSGPWAGGRSRSGSLIVAAAGNNADRPADAGSSGRRPTARRSWPSPRSTQAWASRPSPRAAPAGGGQVDIAGPGRGGAVVLAAAAPGTGRSAARAWRRRTSPASPPCSAKRATCARSACGAC